MWHILNKYRGISKNTTYESSLSPDQFDEFFIGMALDMQKQIPVLGIDPADFIPTRHHHTFSFNFHRNQRCY